MLYKMKKNAVAHVHLPTVSSQATDYSYRHSQTVSRMIRMGLEKVIKDAVGMYIAKDMLTIDTVKKTADGRKYRRIHLG